MRSVVVRSPLAAVASLLMAGSLALSGCSSLSGSDDDRATPDTPSETPSPTETTPASTAWRPVDAAKVASGGTLRLAASALPPNFNPLQADAANTEAARVLAPTTGGAVRITAGGGWAVDPDYARSVEVVDKDPLTVEVKLNRDAVWQGGTSITSADMVAFWRANNGSDDSFEVSSTAGYDAISAVTPGKDKFSYTVTFERPTAEWPQYIYPRLAANVSKSPKLFNKAFRKRAISSNGPFIVASLDTKKGVVTQVPNPRWWGDKPKLAKITWNFVEPDVQAEAFANDELDAVDLQASSYAAAKGTGTIQRAPGVEWSQVTLNGGRGPLQDDDVRRAVAHAIDRDAIAEQVAGAVDAPPAPLGSLLLVPGQEGYQDSSAAIKHDPARAARLLEKAGYTKSSAGTLERDGKALTLTMPVPRDTPANAARARLIVADLAKVGIKVKLKDAPNGVEFYERVVIPLDFDLVTFVRRASPFPITAAKPLFYPLDSPQNFTGVGRKRIGDGFDTVLGTLDDELRAKRIAKLDEWLLDEPQMIPLAVTPLATAVRKGLVNYGASQFEQADWTTVGYVKKRK